MAKVEAGQRTWKDYRLPRVLPGIAPPADLARGESRAAAESILLSALDLGRAVARREINTPADAVTLSPAVVKHVVVKFDDHRERFANRIIPTLQAPDEVWLALYDNGEYRKHYIKAWNDKKTTLAVVTEIRGGDMLYNFIPWNEGGINTRRVGDLLYCKNDK